MENPEKPLGKRSGRILSLREELRIRDDQGGFYFKNPNNLKVAPNGHLFCLDEGEFLEFNPDGRFLKNHFRKGQGPGEFQRIENYLFVGEEIVVHQRGPNKIVVLDGEGHWLRDIKPEETTAKLISFFRGAYVMAQHSFPKVEKIKKKEGDILDIDWNLCLVSQEGKVDRIGGLFRTQWFAKRLPSALIADSITDLLFAPFKEKYIVLSHTQDYRIKVFDLERREIVTTFRRRYKSVRSKAKRKPEERSPFRRLQIPREYRNDVQKIFIRGRQIYVFTSTGDEKKGVLVDVFDMQGRYIDNFYLPLHNTIRIDELADCPLSLEGNFLWIVERDEQDVPSLVKYRILDELASARNARHQQRFFRVPIID